MKSRRNCREKLPVLVNLKWPEAEKDADPEDKPSLRTLRFRDRALLHRRRWPKPSQICILFRRPYAPKDALKAARID